MRIVKRSTLLLLMAAALFLFAQNNARAAITYYSQGSGNPITLSNWNTVRAGGGSLPANFTSGDVFVIQNGHNMTTIATWSISGSGSKLWIENGGTLTADNAVTLNAATTFQIDGSGTYVHNNNGTPSSTIFQGTEAFASASNFEIRNWVNNSTLIPTPTGGFGNLTLNYGAIGGSWNQQGNLSTINGNFVILATGGAEFRLTGNTNFTLNLTGNLSVTGGTLNLASGTGAPTINIGGNFSQTGGTFTSSGSVSTIVFTDGSSSSVYLNQFAGTFTNTNINWQVASSKMLSLLSPLTVAASRSMTVAGDFVALTTFTNNGTTVANGLLLTGSQIANNGVLTVNGTFQIGSAGYISGNAPTYGAASTLKYFCGCTYGRSLEWSATSGAGYPANVQLSNSTTLNYPNGSTAARSISGNLTIDSGSALYMDYGSPGMNNPLTVAGNLVLNGTLSLGDAIGGDLYLGGNLTNSGTWNANSRAVIFYGAGTQNLTANNSTTFNNLTVNSGVTLVETVSADNVNVSGALTNNGIIRKAQTVSGSGTKTFGLAGAYNDANLAINVTTSGSLSNLQVERIDSNHSNATSAQQTGRYWNITATGSGFTTNLTLPRSNSGSPSVCRYSGSGTVWSCATSGNTSNTVTRDNISSYSDWAVGNDAPTVLDLESFRVKLTRAKKAQAIWKTGSEMRLIGFNLYRKRGAQEWVKLNDTMIPAQNIGTVNGARYTFVDTRVKAGKTYRYKLQVMFTDDSFGWSEIRTITIP